MIMIMNKDATQTSASNIPPNTRKVEGSGHL